MVAAASRGRRPRSAGTSTAAAQALTPAISMADAVGPGEVGDLDHRRPAQLRVCRSAHGLPSAAVRAGELAGDPAAGQQEGIRRTPPYEPRDPGRVAAHGDAVQPADDASVAIQLGTVAKPK